MTDRRVLEADPELSPPPGVIRGMTKEQRKLQRLFERMADECEGILSVHRFQESGKEVLLTHQRGNRKTHFSVKYTLQDMLVEVTSYDVNKVAVLKPIPGSSVSYDVNKFAVLKPIPGSSVLVSPIPSAILAIALGQKARSPFPNRP